MLRQNVSDQDAKSVKWPALIQMGSVCEEEHRAFHMMQPRNPTMTPAVGRNAIALLLPIELLVAFSVLLKWEFNSWHEHLTSIIEPQGSSFVRTIIVTALQDVHDSVLHFSAGSPRIRIKGGIRSVLLFGGENGSEQ